MKCGFSGCRPYIEVTPDIDGDGGNDLVLQVNPQGLGLFLATYSGSNFGKFSGLEASGSEISSASGGQIDLDIHFPPEQANWDYQLLLSETGHQLTNLGGLLVPLSSGYWLNATYIEIYPGDMIQNAIATLDQHGKSQIQFIAGPNQISASAIGMTFYAAVVSGEQAGAWSFSSGSIGIEIKP